MPSYAWFAAELACHVRLNQRAAALNLMLGSDTVYTFDLSGRLITAFQAGRLYKRGLDQRILLKQRPEQPGRPEFLYADLDFSEKDQLIEQIRQTLLAVAHSLPADAPLSVRQHLEQLLHWDTSAYQADRQRFLQAYQPVPILPPDQYLALVLQATLGCHYNRCSFCEFYRGRQFAIRGRAEFEAHIEAVRSFFGSAIGLRRTIFLADANALVIPTPRLLELFDAIKTAFVLAPRQLTGAPLSAWLAEHPAALAGITSFMDAFTGKHKSSAELAELAAYGLRRIYIGMESGHVPLLSFLHKPSLPEDVVTVVQSAKQAGLSVGVIVMLGIGGQTYAEGHLRDTLAVIRQLALDQQDLLYVSSFVDHPGSHYQQLALEAHIEPLDQPALNRQLALLRAGLDPRRRVKLARYDIREFIY